MPELLRPFGRLHALGIAVVACLGLAALTAPGFWMWLGLGGALAGTVWTAGLLYRDLSARR